MLTNVYFRLWCGALACCGGAFTALAATQGALDTTSTLTFQLQVVVAYTAKIQDLDDINLGVWTNQAQLQASDQVCVFISGGANYAITFDGTNQPGSFTLNNGAGGTVPYEVAYDDTGAGSNYQVVTATTPLSGQTNASGTENCSGGLNGTIRITTTKADMAAAGQSGSYADTLSVSVTPDP